MSTFELNLVNQDHNDRIVKDEAFKRGFFSKSMFLIGCIHLIFFPIESIFAPHLLKFDLFSTTMGIVFMILAYLGKRNLNLNRAVILLIIFSPLYLTAHVLSGIGLAGAASVWYLIFPMYAGTFINIKSVKYVVLYVALAIVAGVFIENIYFDYFSKLKAMYPYGLSIFRLGIAFFAVGAHVFAFQEERAAILEKLLKEQDINLHKTRLSAVGELAGGIAHEVRTPLNTISMITEEVAEQLERPSLDLPYIKSKLDMILNVVSHINKTIHVLLDYSRGMHSDKFEQVSVQEIVNSALDLSASRLRKYGVKLNLTNHINGCVYCRKIEVSQIIITLINNSIDAVLKSEEPWIEIISRENDEYLTIEVVDNGWGIPPHIAQNIFKSFFTTKESGFGTGIGLSIAKTLAISNGGELSYIPEKLNTTFELKFPKAKQGGV